MADPYVYMYRLQIGLFTKDYPDLKPFDFTNLKVFCPFYRIFNA